MHACTHACTTLFVVWGASKSILVYYKALFLKSFRQLIAMILMDYNSIFATTDIY